MTWLNYHHLLYFWTVATEGTIVRASEVLRLAPSTISVQIKELEESMGEQLFERKGRQLVLTEAGLIVNPVHVIDLALVLPAMIISGRWLQRGKRAGDWFGPSWLVFSVLMGLSIVATMLLELLRGNQEVLPVLILVGIVVLASGWGFRQTAN